MIDTRNRVWECVVMMVEEWNRRTRRTNEKTLLNLTFWLLAPLQEETQNLRKLQFFITLLKRGGGRIKPMFKNYVGNCRVFWRSFNNMKFAWKGTFEALMVKFGGEIGTLYQIFTPCTPLPKYKRAFTWFLGGSNSLPGCRRIFYRGLP